MTVSEKHTECCGQPLFVNSTEMARRLGIAEGEWPRVRTYFEGNGMPTKDPVVKKWFWPAIFHWLNHFYGISDHGSLVRDGKENWDPPPPRSYSRKRRIKE